MRRLIISLGYAYSGIVCTLKAERNFRIHLLAAMLAIALGFYVGVSLVAWGFIVFAIGFVLAAELGNTTIERLCNHASNGERSKIIKEAKDISAAAVLVSAVTAVVIGVMFLLIPLVSKIAG